MVPIKRLKTLMKNSNYYTNHSLAVPLSEVMVPKIGSADRDVVPFTLGSNRVSNLSPSTTS